MRGEIRSVLDSLGGQAARERSGEVDVAPAERMLAITEETGMLLNAMLRHSGATRVLEVGTSAGYSAIWCAEALPEPGTVTTIERDARKAARARANFVAAGLSGSIRVVEGEALGVLGRMRAGGAGPFDMVFIDADKENATRYFDLALPMVRAGGAIIADNMLYPERYRHEMGLYAEHARRHPGVRTMTLPVGNGEEISIKLR